MRAIIDHLCVGGFVLALVSTAPGPACAAQNALLRVIEQGCFARQYDPGHLLAHPRQRVDAVWLRHDGARRANGGTELIFAFRVDGATFGSSAYCEGDRCALEGDGGTFTLRRTDRDLQLTIGDHLSIEGERGFSPDLARSPDDHVFRLRPTSRAVCSAVSF